MGVKSVQAQHRPTVAAYCLTGFDGEEGPSHEYVRDADTLVAVPAHASLRSSGRREEEQWQGAHRQDLEGPEQQRAWGLGAQQTRRAV